MMDVESYDLQLRYTDIILDFSERMNLSLNEAFHKFYQSELYDRFARSTVQEVLSLSKEDSVDEEVREYSV